MADASRLPARLGAAFLATAFLATALLATAPVAGRSIAAQGPTPAADTARNALFARADLARVQGSESAPVWVVVISDFQCPFCKRWHDETKPRLAREYVATGKVRLAYLNFPVASHRNAWPAHEAAMCAAEQDRFWPAADALFATLNTWRARNDAVAFLDSLTRTLPLDHARQAQCVAEGRLKPLIQADYDRAVRAGIRSTPSFFIGSRVIVGAQPYEVFAQAIDEALASARTTPSARR